jgi:hypothetical protein
MWIPSSQARLAAILALAITACGGKKTGARRAPAEILDHALSPATLAAELRKLGGGHVHATATFRVRLSNAAAPADGSKPASPDQVTTTTDLWMDPQGNFRLVEVNDQDGGREIVRVGGEVAVALRYGKMIRRATQDSETARHLGEALGGPWAAWEIVRRQVEVEGGPNDYRLRFADRRTGLPSVFPPEEGLRKWRDSVAVKTLEGQASFEPGSLALRSFDCKTSYQAMRDGAAVEGDLAVSMSVDEVGKTAAIAFPPSDTLQTRQRTVLEERALLGGIAASAAWGAKKN